MSEAAHALDLSNVNHEVAAGVTREWVDQNDACPFAKSGERTYFATPRDPGEHGALRNAISALTGSDNFGITHVGHPKFLQLVEAQKSHFSNSLDGASMAGSNFGQIIAEANAKSDADAEALKR